MKKFLLFTLLLSFGTIALSQEVLPEENQRESQDEKSEVHEAKKDNDDQDLMEVTRIKACSTSQKVKICSIKAEGYIAFSVETTLGSVIVESSKEYAGVDALKLTEGLTKISTAGVSAGLIAHIYGPVQSDIKDAATGTDITIEDIARDLALKISRIK